MKESKDGGGYFLVIQQPDSLGNSKRSPASAPTIP